MTYFAPKGFEEGQPRMTSNLANKSLLLVEIHSLKVWFIVREDLVGLWDNPDLGTVIFNNRSWKVLDWFALEQNHDPRKQELRASLS
jgi:hypothetical protein